MKNSTEIHMTLICVRKDMIKTGKRKRHGGVTRKATTYRQDTARAGWYRCVCVCMCVREREREKERERERERERKRKRKRERESKTERKLIEGKQRKEGRSREGYGISLV